MTVPRPEYPRPQFMRHDWLCLNGEWEFEIDAADSGLERGLLTRPLAGRITVPFSPESRLSGVGHADFMDAVWYRRAVVIPAAWAGRRVLLHFQAVDYDTTVWVNGQQVGRHRGGFTPFVCDLSGVAAPGDEASIVVRAQDRTRDLKPVGKQSQRYARHACLYTRTTGIWQTVWLEPVPESHLLRPRITPDVANGCFHVEQRVRGARPGLRVRALLSDGAGRITSVETPLGFDFSALLLLPVPDDRRRLWCPSDPFLYDLALELVDGDGSVLDQAASYCGLRGIAFDGKAVLLNGRPLFQRLVLDQGYYPDGVMTAPTDEALCRDIELGLEAGFSGARLHQKVFEERFLYHADRLGYLVWGEFPDWGCRDEHRTRGNQRVSSTYITQWLEALDRDYSHPCIVGWCGLNETWQPLEDTLTDLDDVTRGMFLAAKAMDSSRPVIDASGYSHRVRDTDVYDSHDYDQDPQSFAARHAGLAVGRPYANDVSGQPISLPYSGQPYFVSEFGGIWWNPDAEEGEDSWGYGERPRSREEFYARFAALCRTLLDNPDMFGYCYTELTDVYQEQNGIYTFDRRTKFNMARIREVQRRVAAVEKGAAHRPEDREHSPMSGPESSDEV